jgi:hypothetical protein
MSETLELNQSKENLLTPENKNLNSEKVHLWRRCPAGFHFVKEHISHIPPSKTHPQGYITTVHEHCAANPSHKDQISHSEIKYISTNYFSSLSGPPTKNVLTKIFPKADNYDVEIRGWVSYWNDIFNLNAPLDPNLIKALIATESSFEIEPKGRSRAFGLMQLMPKTFSILHDVKGELSNYLIHIPQKEYLDDSANICAGVRWLFQKKKLAGVRLGREASWTEAVIEYKSYWDVVNRGEDPIAMQHFRQYYQLLEQS